MVETAKSKFQTEFEALPLEEKLKTLLRLEATTLTETFNFAVNEPMKVVEKFGEVVSDIGRKVEAEIRKATSAREDRPVNIPTGTNAGPGSSEPSPKSKGPGKKKANQ